MQIGDFADMPSLSSYDIGKKSFEGRRYKTDIEVTKKAMEMLLAPIKEYNERARRNKDKQYRPRMVLTLGNHEERISRAIEGDGRLRHGHGCHAVGEDLTGLEPQVDGVGDLALCPEQRAVVERHRVVLVVPHRREAQFERSEDFADTARREPTLVLDLVWEVYERSLAVVVGQFHGIPQVKIHGSRRVGVDLPLAIVALAVHFPDDDTVGVGSVRDAFAKLFGGRLQIGSGDVVVVGVTPDALDGLGIGFPSVLAGHALVRGDGHRHDLRHPIGVLKIDGVGRHQEVEGIDGLETHALVAGVPVALEDTATGHEGVVHPGQHLVGEVGLLADLVVEPVLGHPCVGVELLAHRYERGDNVHAEGLL